MARNERAFHDSLEGASGDRTGWLGWKDSNFEIPETRKAGPRFARWKAGEIPSQKGLDFRPEESVCGLVRRGLLLATMSHPAGEVAVVGFRQ